MEGNDEQQDSEQQDSEHLKIAENVVSIITKIKKDRNRACLQNVHTFLNRRGIIVEMEKLKVVMDDLILRNIVVDKGKGKESFFVVDSPSVDEEISYISKRDSEHGNTFTALHEFIDEKFYSVLINKIKAEIKLALDDALKSETIHSVNEVNNNKNENKCLDELIATLKDEIKFLRNELVSKDKVIQLLTNDKLNERTEKKLKTLL